MKPYTDFNTERRKEATDEADKSHFKLLNNAAYGKTMENKNKSCKKQSTLLNMYQDLHALIRKYLKTI